MIVSLYSGHILTQKLQIMQNALRLPDINGGLIVCPFPGRDEWHLSRLPVTLVLSSLLFCTAVCYYYIILLLSRQNMATLEGTFHIFDGLIVCL